MNQIKVFIVVAAMCVAALSEDAPSLPPPVPSLPPVADSGAAAAVVDSAAAVVVDSGAAAAVVDSAAAVVVDSGAAPVVVDSGTKSTDGAGTCWECGLETASCTYESFTVPDGEDPVDYQDGSDDPERPCNFCIVQKSEDPDHKIKLLYRGCNDYDPTNGGTMPSYPYEQDGVIYTVTSKACNTALCNQN